jgi:hypothetical protein
MAFTLGAIAAKDGAGVTIPGGLLAADIAGGDVGPWILFKGLVDGVAGVNRAAVTSTNALKVEYGAGMLLDGVTHGTLGSGNVAYFKMMDGTDGGIETAKILAASTAPTATDPAIVVAISPNGMNANGAAVSSSSAPVVLATDQAWGVGSAGFTKLEDVAAASGDKGVPAFVVQTATPADTAADGDWTWLQSKNGRLYVEAIIRDISDGDYETVAASQTDQVLGPTGATGDYLGSVWIIPATVDPGIVQIQDGGGTAVTVFAGGTGSVATLHPFQLGVGIKSTAGAWSVTTGTNVSVLATGNFT